MEGQAINIVFLQEQWAVATREVEWPIIISLCQSAPIAAHPHKIKPKKQDIVTISFVIAHYGWLKSAPSVSGSWWGELHRARIHGQCSLVQQTVTFCIATVFLIGLSTMKTGTGMRNKSSISKPETHPETDRRTGDPEVGHSGGR